MSKHTIAAITSLLVFTISGYSQTDSLSYYKEQLNQSTDRLNTLRYTELVQSMSQRSQLTPNYFFELKALIARQAYNFWIQNEGEKYVSHLNIYSAMYYANKLLTSDSREFDSYGFMKNPIAYNQAAGHDENVTSLKFSPDPNFFYSAGSDGKVIKWDLRNIKNVPEVIYQGDHLITSIDISYDGQWLMIVTKEKGIVMLNLKNSSLENRILAVDPTPVYTAMFMPDELRYLTANRLGRVVIKDFNLEETEIGKSTSKVYSLAVKEDDKKIFAGTEDGLVHIWKDTMHSVLYSQQIRAIHSLSISHNKKYLALGDEFGEAIIWDIDQRVITRRIFGHSSAVTKVEFSPDDSRLLSASRDGTVRIWDLTDAKKLPLVLDDHQGWVMTAAFNPEGDKIITGSSDKFIRIFSVAPDALAERICSLVSRNMTEEEWKEYVGKDIPYQKTCPDIGD